LISLSICRFHSISFGRTPMVQGGDDGRDDSCPTAEVVTNEQKNGNG
jgi:hypothetical protein